MKSISPFQVPRHFDLDNQTATSIESHFKVIETITDYQESKAFRARLSGAISSFWNVEANCSTLDLAKVNSKDIFGYYSLLFTKSRVVVSSSTLNNLPLTKDAERAVRSGRFRELYGDMIVVGFITGGEAEAVMRVTNFKEDRRDAIRKALRTALQDNATATTTSSTGVRGQVEAAVSAVAAAVATGGAVEYMRGQEDAQALQDATTTLLSRRTGVTHPGQLHNPNNFPQLLFQLTKAAENTGVKISALCYRVELFSQVPVDVLGFARVVVDENVSTLQKQFAQVQFVYNSCEAHLAPGSTTGAPDHILREVRKLQRDACAAMQRFAHFKGYRDVGQLSASDPARTVGAQLVQRFDDLCERMRAAEVRAQAQAQLAHGMRLAKRFESESAAADLWRGGSAASAGPSSGPPTPSALPGQLPPAAVRPVSQTTASGAASTTSTPCYCDGVLHVRLLAGRNFSCGKVLSTQPYVVVKLDGKTFTSPTMSGVKSNTTFLWNYDFRLEVPARLLEDDAALVLEVYDKNTLMSDKFLGAVSMSLRQACGRAAQLGLSSMQALVADGDRSRPNWYPVEKVDSGKYKCRGELKIELRYSTDLSSMQPAPELSADGDELPRQLMRPLTNNLRQLAPSSSSPSTPMSAAGDPSSAILAYPTIPGPTNIPLGFPVAGMHAWPQPQPQPGGTACAALATGAPGMAAPASLVQEASEGDEECAGAGCGAVKMSRSFPFIWTPAVSHEQNRAAAAAAESTDDDEDEASDSDDEGRRRRPAGSSAEAATEQGAKGKRKWAVDVVAADASSAAAACSLAAPANKEQAAQVKKAEAEAKNVEVQQRKRRGLRPGEEQSEEGPQSEDDAHSKRKVARPRQEADSASSGKSLPKRRRGRGFLGLLLRLAVTGTVLGSAGAAAVVVGHRRFGVDLVAESRRIAVQYGEIAGRAANVWARDGSKAVQGWTRQLASKLRFRQQQQQHHHEQQQADGAAVDAGPSVRVGSGGEVAVIPAQ